MKKNIIFLASAFVVGIAVGYFVGKNRASVKKIVDDEPVKLYPDNESDNDELNDFDPEDSEDDITRKGVYEVAKNNGYISEISEEEIEDIEAIESSKRYMRYMEKHAGEISIISPDSDKRSDEINEVLEFLDRELLLYFPDRDVLTTEVGDWLDISDATGNCLYKYHFDDDDSQNELHVLNVPKQMYFIVRKETENTVEELFPD